jgi:hypothetical protein
LSDRGVEVDDDALRAAVDDASARLGREPLWHASLGSKELFHSNLLGWALETWADRGRHVLGLSGDAAVGGVRREYLDLDLVVEFADGEVLVVENKAFALPDEAQLRRYAEVVAKRISSGARLVLLSLTDPGWRDGELVTEHGTWRFVSYRELGRRLHEAFAPGESFAEQVVVHHATLMQQLADVMDLVADVGPEDPLVVPADLRERMKSIRIADAVAKARVQATMNLIRARIGAPVGDTAGTPERFEANFSNGTPLLSLYYWAGPRRRVGWQFQNGQWRLAMMFGDLAGRSDESRAARVQAAREHSEFFDFGPMQNALGHDDIRARWAHDGRLDFNRFDDDFVYRYRKLAPETSVATIVELGVTYARHAAEWSTRDLST